MTPEEVERHLSARGHSFMGLLPERAPPTVPTEMFSNEPSLDRLVSADKKYFYEIAKFHSSHLPFLVFQ